MKLDPGPMGRVNGARYDVDRLIDAYRALKPYTVQAMVVRGTDWDGGSDESLARWLPLLVRAEPDAVQLCSLSRPPADAAVQNVPRERLEEMARATRSALPRCQVDVF
jgi:wyosine [tRNA(Phe)-imidazoG37] synthetase (radical SAM superfamily)